ncbi:hypothetical protein F5B22DRAFT_657961 [Xylaria bambusicola]|uniref:uncharacterized protein n=1 Tax=Xylaria bambusicola TaxID=326684 RepID=UPI0020085A92|nr:uncharacterized protein F5B22DRAFT_657961 [Xylaria bambusicola]KAI0509575.1 hypothetical protein F5B22DRAFT_657961 [Xylaria bambusicola]
MHSSVFLSLIAGATSAMAIIVGVGPAPLHIVGKNDSSIDGYARPCHIDADDVALCYAEKADDKSLNQFYFNYSIDATNGVRIGAVTLNLNVTTANDTKSYPSFLIFRSGPGTNMQLVHIPAGGSLFEIMSAKDNGVIYISGQRDDRNWNETQPYKFVGDFDVDRFFLCWQWIGYYWRQSIAWASSLPPQNPSCKPVDLRIGV